MSGKNEKNLSEVYVPKKSAVPTNKQILARHKTETKTIQIRQVDVEKMIEKLPSDESVSEPHTPPSEISVEEITPIPLPDAIAVPKLKKIKKIIDIPEEQPQPDDEKKGLLEKNGDGYYINDEEDFDKIDGLKNIELFTLLFELSNRIYREMGSGHTESIYQKALTIELINHDIYHEKEKRVLITYQDKKHGRVYSLGEERVDVFLLDYNLIIELKAVNNIPREQELTQIKKYYRELLKAGTILDKWGLIINFPQPGPTKKAKNNIDFVLVNL